MLSSSLARVRRITCRCSASLRENRLPVPVRSSMITVMGRTKMHADEIHTDVGLVRRLLAGEFPQWAELPITYVESYGTDHDIYRLGGALSVRLPRIAWATKQAAKEAYWLPKLAP